MEIKDILKNRRIELSLTQLDVAKAVGVSEATISRWESGDIANMRRSRIAALATVLKISPAIIMGWTEEDSLENPSSTPGKTTATINIAAILKQLRKSSRKSMKTIIEQLGEQGITVSEKILYTYESGLNMPSARIFLALCKIYNCTDFIRMFSDINYDSQEQSHMLKYCRLDKHGKMTVDLITDRELERAKETSGTQEAFSSTNMSNYFSLSPERTLNVQKVASPIILPGMKKPEDDK